MRFAALLLLALGAAAAAFLLRGSGEWIVTRPAFTVRTGTIDPRADETSGVTASAAHPGLFWTILDSGNPAELVALDSAGRLIGVVPLDGAVNTDWEALALGPCGPERCVYVGDIGDNLARRGAVTLYRVPEPSRQALDGGRPAGAVETLHFRYPDGPRDAEALIVTPDGTALIVTKGLLSPIQAYRVPAGAWGRADTVTADSLGSLPIDTRTALGRWVTDGALAPDGRRVALRTYRDVFFFEVGPGNTLRPGDPPLLCDISGLEPQGEGVGWASDSALVLTSEGGRRGAAVMHLIGC